MRQTEATALMRGETATPTSATLVTYFPELPAPRSAWSMLGHAARRIRNTVALSVTLMGGLLALAAGFPWSALAVSAAGGVTYCVLVVRDLFAAEPGTAAGLSAAVARALRDPLVVPCSESEVANAHQRLLAEVRATHEAIRTRLVARSSHPPPVLEAYMCCTELARRAGHLALRGRDISEYLESHCVAEHEDALAELLERAWGADDPPSRADLIAAAHARERHLAMLGELERLFERVTAQLVSICTSLQLVEAQLVKLATCDQSSAPVLDVPDPSELLELALASCELVDELLDEPTLSRPITEPLRDRRL